MEALWQAVLDWWPHSEMTLYVAGMAICHSGTFWVSTATACTRPRSLPAPLTLSVPLRGRKGVQCATLRRPQDGLVRKVQDPGKEDAFG